MTKYYYFPKARMTSRIADMIIDGFHISLDGYIYELITKRPNGRRTLRNLINMDATEKFVILA